MAKVSVPKVRCIAIDLDDRFGNGRSRITGVKNKLKCLEAVIADFEVHRLVANVAKIPLKGLLYGNEVPSGLEGANEPRSFAGPKIEASIDDICAAQLPADRRMRGSLGGIEAENRNSPLANFRRPDLEPRPAAAPKAAAGLEVLENSIAFSELEKGIG